MVLAAKAACLREAEFAEFFQFTEHFLNNCRAELATDDSLREGTWSALGQVCDKFAYVAIRLKRPAAAIGPLSTCVELVRCGVSTQLTAAHPALVQVCLVSKLYHAALPFVESPAISQASKTTGCRPKDLLIYLYYAGRVYLGTKQFSKAHSLFLRALAMPAECAHAAHWQCRQKVIFTSLLVTGDAPEVNMYSSGVASSFDKACAVYRDLIAAFVDFDAAKFDTELAKLNDKLVKGRNNGLARQCAAALKRRCVARLAQVHASAPLAQVKEEAGLATDEAAEALLLQMVSSGELLAKLSHKDNVVTFPTRSQEFSSLQSAAQLKQCLHRQFALLGGIQELSADIQQEPQFIVASLTTEEKEAGNDKAMDDAIALSLKVK
eukprot:TRINITY_DN8915_c0_g2_i2.p1 TRINITY_DN8915_c0_g2~~TRINITY_DN8915_c0_g2_i2.p1  ORF type:complete len:380 (+),score=135.93 TRINITY_DN8915_c0_g2_i2:131-1270(+)